VEEENEEENKVGTFTKSAGFKKNRKGVFKSVGGPVAKKRM